MRKNEKSGTSSQKVNSRNRNKNKNQSMQVKAKEKRLARSSKGKSELVEEVKEKLAFYDTVDAVDVKETVANEQDVDDDFIKIVPRKFVEVDDENQKSKINKFEFVSKNEKLVNKDLEELEEIYEYEETSNGETIEVDNSVCDTVSGDDYILPPTDKVDINARRYFSFESRIVILLIIIIVSFFGAGLLIYKAVTVTDSDKIIYDEKSTINYNVCINDSSNYYKEACLDEGMEYIVDISDKILVDFDYVVDYSKEIDSKLNYYAVSKISVYNQKGGKVLHTTEEVLLERTSYSVLGQKANISVDVSIPFNEYSSYVKNYNAQYNVDSYAVLDIDFYVDNGNVIKKAAALNMPLTGATYSIEKYDIENEKVNFNVLTDDWSNINSSYALVGIIFVLFGLLAIIRLANLVYKITATSSLYEKKLQRILREYDRLIVIARGDYTIDDSKKLIKVTSFLELLDARNTLEKPIVYVRVNNVKSEFFVEDSEAIYKFTLKEADFEGK